MRTATAAGPLDHGNDGAGYEQPVVVETKRNDRLIRLATGLCACLASDPRLFSRASCRPNGFQDIEWFAHSEPSSMESCCKWLLVDTAHAPYSTTINYPLRNPWIRHVLLAALSGRVFGESSTGWTWSFLHASLMAG